MSPIIDFHIHRNLNKLQHQLKQPNFAKFYLYFCSTVFVCTKLLTSVKPSDGLIFLHVAFLIDQVTSAVFASGLEEHQQMAFIPSIGQFSHIVISALISNLLCSIFFRSLNVTQMGAMGGIFVLSLILSKKAMAHFNRKHQI